MKNNVMLFIFYFLMWAGLNWPMSGFEAVCGIIISLVIVLILEDVFVARPYLVKRPGQYFWGAVYVSTLAWEAVRAAINNCLLLSRRKLNITPGIVEVRTILKSETAISLLANSITLSLGTCVVDVDSREGILYVHWMDARSYTESAATAAIVRKFEKILKKIFE